MEEKMVKCPMCGGQRIIASHKGVKCPQCGSQKVWKDARRYTPSGPMQRYLCRDCGLRFSRC